MQRYEQKMTVSVVVTDTGESKFGITFEPELPDTPPKVDGLENASVMEQAQYFIMHMAAAIYKEMRLDTTEMKKPEDWAQEMGVTILDPDGWRRDGKDFEQRVTKKEFKERLIHCTLATGGGDGRHS